MNFKDFLNEETKYTLGEACDLEWGNVPYFNYPDFCRSTVEIWNIDI